MHKQGKRQARSSERTEQQGVRNRPWEELGDFTATIHILPITGLALAIGVLASFVAFALLRLIGLFTNLFYFGRWSTVLVSPVGNHLGIFSVLVPIGGALIIGIMARYGSERIRGHGIPEAIEAILINGSRVEPKVALRFLRRTATKHKLHSISQNFVEVSFRTRHRHLRRSLRRTSRHRRQTQNHQSCAGPNS